jgi:hypothetical protein
VSPRERLRRFRAGLTHLKRLSGPDRSLFLQAWQCLVASRIRVGVGGIDWTEVVLETPKPLASATPAIDPLLAVFDAARDTLPFGATCLPRSLALRNFLEQQGIATRLRLGARKVGEEWNGHVWVERRGQLVGDRPELVSAFVPFRETA